MDEKELVELDGSIESVVYQNEENGYSVLKVLSDSGEMVTAVGCLPYACPGENIIAAGLWTEHRVHGHQFKIEYVQRMMPSSVEGIYEYISSGVIKGVGPATAAMIIDRFGVKTFDVIESHPEKLAEVKGISESKARKISEDFHRLAGTRRLLEFICSYDLSPVYAIRLYKIFKDDALMKVQENPYILCIEDIGASFSDADYLALNLGIEYDSIERIKAAVCFELAYNEHNGHCFIPKKKLANATATLIQVDEQKVIEGIEELTSEGKIIERKLRDDFAACYLKSVFEAEEYTAKRIAEMLNNRLAVNFDVDDLISKAEKNINIEYTPLQRSIIDLALKNQIIVLTGGPGTGKTTSIRALLTVFESLNIDTMLAAPTGRAAKRMAELTGRETSTIHRLLGAHVPENGEGTVFDKDEDDPLSCEALIIDESSMVDIVLMKAVLMAISPSCRLILVGDVDQLPSVGPGAVFSDIIRSQTVPTVRLTEIFRQKQGSRIVRNAHAINNGRHPDMGENTGDFFRLQRTEADSVVSTVVSLCADRIPNNMKIPASDIQILTPTRKGETGTVNLNKYLQNALNPSGEDKQEKIFGEVIFRVGDRVMQTRNNYDIIWKNADGTASGLGIYNGDIGTIMAIESESMLIDYDGHIARYGFEMLNEIEHAWAMTIHKSQGSEYKVVILALNSAADSLLTRGVLYTAVTRAKEMMIVVGSDALIDKMIDNDRKSRRYTNLRSRILYYNELLQN